MGDKPLQTLEQECCLKGFTVLAVMDSNLGGWTSLPSWGTRGGGGPSDKEPRLIRSEVIAKGEEMMDVPKIGSETICNGGSGKRISNGVEKSLRFIKVEKHPKTRIHGEVRESRALEGK